MLFFNLKNLNEYKNIRLFMLHNYWFEILIEHLIFSFLFLDHCFRASRLSWILFTSPNVQCAPLHHSPFSVIGIQWKYFD